jgi:light-regulated signal transduction histidine kinase (bacteriophytochrome)
LIDDLLAFSRIGRVALRMEPVNQNQLIAEVVANGRYEADGRAITWEIRDLPHVRADVAMLRQVWANLIENAVKYSSKGPAPRITIGGSEHLSAGEFVFFVRDNGVGFDMAYADKLFGVFQRLHGPADFDGTGIGLANVRRIITRHGGRTWAEGRINEGAVFYFSLPFSVSSTGSSS